MENGLVTVWHPLATPELMRDAFGDGFVTVVANSIDDVAAREGFKQGHHV